MGLRADFFPRRTARPRHKAQIPDLRAGAVAVAAGLLASAAALAITVTIANGGHHPAEPPLAAAAGQAQTLPRFLPRPVNHLSAVPLSAHRRGAARQRAAGGAASSPAWGSAPAPVYMSASSMLSNWEEFASRTGLPPWAQRMLSP